MVLAVPISSEAEAALQEKARAANTDLTTYVTALIEQAAKPALSLKEISGPVADDFAKSGMTDDEFGDLLEEAKHEMRAEKRARKSQ